MIILVLILLGLCFGSFTNALVWRVHKQSQAKSKAAQKELSILTGRSMCPSCRHQLGFWDLIPVASWLALRSKCRYCHKKYDDTPVAELLVPAIFVLSYLYWPFGWSHMGTFQFIVWLIMVVGFVALTLYDMRWMLLPNRLIYPLTALAAAQVLILAFWQGDFAIIVGAALGVVCLAGLFYGLFQLSQGRWIGGGDVRLAIIIGLLVGGPIKAIMVLLFASFIGSAFAMPFLITKKKHLAERVPFGPFLIAGTIIVYLFGTTILTWYKGRFLLL